MMRKTVKSRSTESSAAAERLADYKGDVSTRFWYNFADSCVLVVDFTLVSHICSQQPLIFTNTYKTVWFCILHYISKHYMDKSCKLIHINVIVYRWKYLLTKIYTFPICRIYFNFKLYIWIPLPIDVVAPYPVAILFTLSGIAHFCMMFLPVDKIQSNLHSFCMASLQHPIIV